MCRTDASKRREGGATEIHRCGLRRPVLSRVVLLIPTRIRAWEICLNPNAGLFQSHFHHACRIHPAGRGRALRERWKSSIPCVITVRCLGGLPYFRALSDSVAELVNFKRDGCGTRVIGIRRLVVI